MERGEEGRWEGKKEGKEGKWSKGCFFFSIIVVTQSHIAPLNLLRNEHCIGVYGVKDQTHPNYHVV